MGYLHITGGSIKNRKIIGPRNQKTRPMQSFLRKTLFDLIPPLSLENSIVWDIFAGSGVIGLEALSRGAGKVFFVEKDLKMTTVIRRNVELCGFRDQTQVLYADFFNLKRWVPKVDPPNIVFLDPPFSTNPVEVLEKMYNLFELVKNSLIVIRFSKKSSALFECSFYQANRRTYGDSVLMFGSF